MPQQTDHNRAPHAGSAAWYTVQFSPVEQRARLLDWFAWFGLLDELANKAKDPGIARLKLDWWREEIKLMRQAKARHPVAQTLQNHTIDDWQVTQMQRAIDATEQRILRSKPRSEDQLTQQCADRFGSRLQLLCQHQATELDQLGQTLGICILLKQLPNDLLAEHNPLPQQTYDQLGLNLTNLAAQTQEVVPRALQTHLLQLAGNFSQARLRQLHTQQALRPALRLTGQHMAGISNARRNRSSTADGALWTAWRLRN